MGQQASNNKGQIFDGNDDYRGTNNGGRDRRGGH